MRGSNTVPINSAWLSINGAPAPELEAKVRANLEKHFQAGNFSPKDAHYVEQLNRKLSADQLDLPEKQLEQLRRLCQLWEVDLKIGEITSHRKFLGPVIVAVKKLLLPIMKVLFKKTLRQQKDFNAAVVAYLVEYGAQRPRDQL